MKKNPREIKSEMAWFAGEYRLANHVLLSEKRRFSLGRTPFLEERQRHFAEKNLLFQAVKKKRLSADMSYQALNLDSPNSEKGGALEPPYIVAPSKKLRMIGRRKNIEKLTTKNIRTNVHNWIDIIRSVEYNWIKKTDISAHEIGNM